MYVILSELGSVRNQTLGTDDQIQQLNKQLQQEKLLKLQAVNKLAEIMNRKDWSGNKHKSSVSDIRKKEKECRKLQQELTVVSSRIVYIRIQLSIISSVDPSLLTCRELLQEREKYNQMVARYQKELSEVQALLYDESQARLKLQMERDSKDSEIEQLQQKLALLHSDTASVNSGGNDTDLQDENSYPGE